MCLFRRSKLQIAKEDLITYKVVSSNLKSQYYCFQYEISKSYSKKWDKDFVKHCEQSDTIGGNAFHSSLDRSQAIWMYGEKSIWVTAHDNQEPKGELSSDQVLLKCIIPAGSKYFLGYQQEIASEQIIIKEICH